MGVLQLLVPRPEALALPTAVRTSNAEAHADMYITPSAYLIYNKVYLRLVNTHPWTSTAAMFFDSLMNLARFQIVKNKALSKRLIHKSIPTVKSLLMSNFFPPSAGFCFGGQPQGTHSAFDGLPQPASADKISDVVNIGKFMKKY